MYVNTSKSSKAFTFPPGKADYFSAAADRFACISSEVGGKHIFDCLFWFVFGQAKMNKEKLLISESEIPQI
jgi:hypothetical protein